jgi:ubiquinone/menaquinone biosynthesis C-methylase UbiE
MDLSADMVAAATHNLREFGDRASVHAGDVTRLPFADDAFDAVVTSFSMHHWDHPAGAVPELARVLRPGGRLYVYDFGHAPFQVLTETASEQGLFDGAPVRKTRILTAVPEFSRCDRLTMTA